MQQLGSRADSRDDLDFAKGIHYANNLGFESFAFPRNAVGHVNVLARACIQVARRRDVGLLRTAHHGGRLSARAANYVDQFLPVPPRPSFPEARLRSASFFSVCNWATKRLRAWSG
jgi:hypothetical protein